jgi:putative tryptophan/tyrosine transport system substrate-binding protein
MRRRHLLGLVGGLLMSPLAARAQPSRTIPRVGLVSIGADPGNPVIFLPFLDQLRALGYIEGQNVILERRFAAGRAGLIDGFVADLVNRNVDVIVTTGGREAEAAKRATTSIPIVTVLPPDLIGSGLAQSLARPGGNLTGLTVMEAELDGKRIEMLKQAVPGLHKMGLMISRTRDDYKPESPRRRVSEAVARSLNVSLDWGEFDTETAEIAVGAIAARGVQGLVYPADGVALSRRKEIADRAISLNLPTIFALRQNVDAGGLLSYSARVSDLSRRAAFFVDRILKGAKPADLPIEQPTTFELVINLRTAKALGITFPSTFLAIADEVVE